MANAPEEQAGAEQQHVRSAIETIVDSYQRALNGGVPAEIVANAALTTALGFLVQVHGAEVVARMVEELPDKVREGKFTPEDG
jgi:hypothetical protein